MQKALASMLLEFLMLSTVNIKLEDNSLEVKMEHLPTGFSSAQKSKSVPPSKLKLNRLRLAQFLQKDFRT